MYEYVQVMTIQKFWGKCVVGVQLHCGVNVHLGEKRAVEQCHLKYWLSEHFPQQFFPPLPFLKHFDSSGMINSKFYELWLQPWTIMIESAT